MQSKGAVAIERPRLCGACPLHVSQADMGTAASWMMRSSSSIGSAARWGPLGAACRVSSRRAVFCAGGASATAASAATSGAGRQQQGAGGGPEGVWPVVGGGWWVEGLQVPPRATNTSLQQSKRAADGL